MNKNFIGHIISQACGAINDNLFRNVFVLLIISQAVDTENGLEPLLGLFFILPFLIFAPFAGNLSDSIPRVKIIRAVRIAEPFLCAFGAFAIYTNNPTIMITSISLFGLQSAIFAPTKYSILPNLVKSEKLESANGILSATTNIAILIGITLSALTDKNLVNYSPTLVILSVGLGISIIGIIGAFLINPIPSSKKEKVKTNFFAWKEQIAILFKKQGLLIPVLCLSGFWIIAAAFSLTLPKASLHIFNLSVAHSAMIPAILAISMGLGAIIVPKFILRSHPAGMPCFGALLTIISLLLCANSIRIESLNYFIASVALIGFFSSFWTVPLTFLLHIRTTDDIRGRVFAAFSFLTSAGLLVGFALLYLLNKSFGPYGLINIFAYTALTIALFPFIAYRHDLTAWLINIVTKIFYKIRVTTEGELPENSGAIIVCNHISYADGIILASSFPKPIRFMIFKKFVDMPILGFLLRAMKSIPIDGEDSRKSLVNSINSAVEAAKNGDFVCIFPEGKLSRNGSLDKFQKGIEKIATRAGVPIIPVGTLGLENSFVSRMKNRELPQVRRSISVKIGTPLNCDTKAADIRQVVSGLLFDLRNEKSKKDTNSLGKAFLKNVKRRPFKTIITEAAGDISFFKMAVAAFSLWKPLKIKNEKTVGVLLPPTRAGGIIQAMLAIKGQTVANLNHTVGEEALKYMCEVSGVKTIIASKLYLRKIDLSELKIEGVRIVCLEDIKPLITPLIKISAILKVLFVPSCLLAKANGDSVAGIVFSSGSTGKPKGVQLTNRQIQSNINHIIEHFNFTKNDCLCSPLPLFHSFGLGPGTWTGLSGGIPLALHPNPSDGEGIGELCQKAKVTCLISSPTFTKGYMRRITKEQFKTLKSAVVGSEKCSNELKKEFKEKYDAELFEGYGCTELSPVVSTECFNTKIDGVLEKKQKNGSVGKAIPGIDVFTMSPDTNKILPVKEEGLLIVRSTSRMLGYLNQEELTKEVFVHGGYNTGDIGYVDEEGFIFITGRLSRFAKIGGEMVPLDKVESIINTINKELGCEGEVAVSAIPDKNKGEKLIVLYTELNSTPAELLQKVELPPIFKPKARDFHKIDEIPVLGTGKRSLGEIKEIALSFK